MANSYLEMGARIADELNRTDLTSQIFLSVASAIAHYEGERFWFNEDRTLTFSASSSLEYYSSTDFAQVENLLDIDSIVITINSNRFELQRRTWDWFEENATSASTFGQPTDFTYYQQRIRLYPIPNTGYPLRVASTVRLPALSISYSASIAWCGDAEELIRSRAKADLYENLLFDDAKADRMRRREAEELSRLRRETNRRLGTGELTPTRF